MSLGVCCQWIDFNDTTLQNCLGEKTIQKNRYLNGHYDNDQPRNIYISNVRNLLNRIPDMVSFGLRTFRISSSIFPLHDLVQRSQWDNDDVKSLLKTLGQEFTKHGIRVTTHPGQFCVISSDSQKVVDVSISELVMHGWMFDCMGFPRSPQYAINIHGGKSARSRSLISVIKSLPDSVRLRMTLENDELSYSVVDLLNVHIETGVPIVFDSHHHVFNDGCLTMQEAFDACCQTFPTGVKPLQHISNTEKGNENLSFSQRRKHSDFIHYVPDCQLSALRDDIVDVEVEAKMKNLAVYDMSKTFECKI